MSETAENKSRFLYLDFLRIFAIFAVIVNHYVGWRYAAPIGSTQWWINITYLGLLQWPTPILLMVSGALFVNRSIPLKKLFGKYIFRIVSAFLFWSAIYAAVFDPHSTVFGFITNVVYGHYHLWFMYMIAGIYLVQPIYHKIAESKETALYLILVSAFFMFAVPDTIEILQVLSPSKPILSNLVEKSLGNMFINFSEGFGACFLLGWFLHENTMSRRTERCIYTMSVAAVLVTIIGTGWICVFSGQICEVFLNGTATTTLFASAGLFLAAKKLEAKVTFTNKQIRLIQRISKDSFGVYLMHALVIRYITPVTSLIRVTCGEISANFIVPALVFVISLCISDLINRIPVLNKYIV